MVVDGNMEVMTALYKYYENLVREQDWPLPVSCAERAQIFAKQINNAIYDLKMQSSRSRALARHTSERKNLVRPLLPIDPSPCLRGMKADF
jgi:hypothetical protein